MCVCINILRQHARALCAPLEPFILVRGHYLNSVATAAFIQSDTTPRAWAQAVHPTALLHSSDVRLRCRRAVLRVHGVTLGLRPNLQASARLPMRRLGPSRVRLATRLHHGSANVNARQPMPRHVGISGLYRRRRFGAQRVTLICGWVLH